MNTGSTEANIGKLMQNLNNHQKQFALWLLSMHTEWSRIFHSSWWLIDDIFYFLWKPIYLFFDKETPSVLCPATRMLDQFNMRLHTGKDRFKTMMSEEEFRTVENIHDHWSRIINQHKYYYSAGRDFTVKPPHPSVIENSYRNILMGV